ncbi:MAG: Asp23/Gls24 family envelope stress response protein [Candidatus Omnitrophica bacterium]|nr:Asp23/Gls24 family envelope stress response protein [Candidatus Omnitrophota bacterium]
MAKDDSATGLGAVNIHKNVIASIAYLAAEEIDGVKGIGRNMKANFLELLGFRHRNSGIRVEIDKNSDVRIEIPLIVKYGFNIPDIASKVQENVSSAVDKMTNLSIIDINVSIVGIERG